MSTTNTAELKQEFEAWAKQQGLHFGFNKVIGSEDYLDNATHYAFIGYVAGRSAAQGESAYNLQDEVLRMLREDNSRKARLIAELESKLEAQGEPSKPVSALDRMLNSGDPDNDPLMQASSANHINAAVEMVQASCDGGKCGVGGYCDDCKAGSAEQVSEREAFEMWAKSHGGLSLTPVGTGGGTRDGLFPATYWQDATEIAWRAWANKPARAALSAPERKVTDAEIAAIAKRLEKEDLHYTLIDFARAVLNQQGEQTAPGWQPIETAPKDGTPVLLGRIESEFHTAESTVGWWQDAVEDGVDYMGGDAGFVDFAFQVFNPGRSFGNPKYMYAADQPTHWMPLPACPSTAQKDGE